MASYQRTDKLIALSRESITYKNEDDMKEASRKIALELSEQALIIPLFNIPAAYMIQPWVHTTYLEMGMVRWKMFDMWMEKH